MGAQHMLRNKIDLQMVDEANVLRLSREALDESGVVVADVRARVVQPESDELSGINLAFETGDRSPACNLTTDPFCDGGGYDNYTIEVVDRMGADSFTPDSGVLLAKTKNSDERPPFEWVIDANPQDIGMTDYVLPDGTAVPITIGDYRQLSDALFHAGTDSGSEFEYVDSANRLHVYVLDRERSGGELSYTVAIRSLDGSGAGRHGVRLLPTAGVAWQGDWARCRFPLRNTGRASVAGQHPEDVSAYLGADVYRLSATAQSSGWSVRVPNALAVAQAGTTGTATVYAKRESGGRLGRITLTARSESDPTRSDTATCVAVSR